MFKTAAFTLLGLIWIADIGLAWSHDVGFIVAVLAVLTIPYLAIYAMLAWVIRKLSGEAVGMSTRRVDPQ